MKRAPITILSILAVSLLFSCGRPITITRHEIYHPTWANGKYQAFTIAKIHLNKQNISISNKDFNRFDLADFTIDSSFCFHPAPVKKKTGSVGPIYFDRENETFSDWFDCRNFTDRRRTIGPLEVNNWYIIQELGGTVDYFAFIDDKEQVHIYTLGPTNW